MNRGESLSGRQGGIEGGGGIFVNGVSYGHSRAVQGADLNFLCDFVYFVCFELRIASTVSCSCFPCAMERQPGGEEITGRYFSARP